MFQIGKITNTHGIKGENKVFPTTDDVERFGLLQTLKIRKNDEISEYELVSFRPHKNTVIIKLKGIDSCNDAEKLIGSDILIDDEFAIPLLKNEYYVRDLYGLLVYEYDRLLGELTDVLHTGANDVYSVKKPDGKELLIPAIKQCILNVDLKAGKMQVKLLEGLDG